MRCKITMIEISKWHKTWQANCRPHNWWSKIGPEVAVKAEVTKHKGES